MDCPCGCNAQILSNPPLEKVLYQTPNDIASFLNKLSKSEIEAAKDPMSYPLVARMSLQSFIMDWERDDPDHATYLSMVPEGYPEKQALVAGDLLAYLMVGGKGRAKWEKGDKLEPWTRWEDYIGPFLKKLPASTRVQDLTGVHLSVLDMLPQQRYNQYSYPELFAVAPQEYESIVGPRVQLQPAEFEALQMLSRIVERGDLEQLKLTMFKGSSSRLVEAATKASIDIGALMLEAFTISNKAVRAFQQGDFHTAREHLQDLERGFDIGKNSFAVGIDELFVATASYASVTTSGGGGGGRSGGGGSGRSGGSRSAAASKGRGKGSGGGPDFELIGTQAQWFMSLDASTPGLNDRKKASSNIRTMASHEERKYNSRFSEGDYLFAEDKMSGGTYGLRVAKTQKQDTVLTTDWTMLFYAAKTADNIAKGAFDPPKREEIVKTIFGDDKKKVPVLRFHIHGRVGETQDLSVKGILTVALRKNESIVGHGDAPIYAPDVSMILNVSGEEFRDMELPTIEQTMASDDDGDLMGRLQEAFEGMSVARRRAARGDSGGVLFYGAQGYYTMDQDTIEAHEGIDFDSFEQAVVAFLDANPTENVVLFGQNDYYMINPSEYPSFEVNYGSLQNLLASGERFVEWSELAKVKESTGRRASKKSSKKRVDQGNMIAIELTPSTQVEMAKSRDKISSLPFPHYLKELAKEDPDFKDIYEGFQGMPPTKDRSSGKWVWKGQEFKTKKEAQAYIKEKGSWADKKGGKANMQMIYAPRIDNGRFVPFRIFIPKILVRHDPETKSLIAKKGSGKTKKVEKLLRRIERDFGPIRFKSKPLSSGGFDVYKDGKFKTRVDRGVSQVFKATGLDTGGAGNFTTRAFPSSVRSNGDIVYMAMTSSGRPVEMEVSR